jgi:hypothetical protein
MFSIANWRQSAFPYDSHDGHLTRQTSFTASGSQILCLLFRSRLSCVSSIAMLPSSDRLGTIPISAFQGGQLPASYCPCDRGEGAAKTWRLGAVTRIFVSPSQSIGGSLSEQNARRLLHSLAWCDCIARLILLSLILQNRNFFSSLYLNDPLLPLQFPYIPQVTNIKQNSSSRKIFIASPRWVAQHHGQVTLTPSAQPPPK